MLEAFQLSDKGCVRGNNEDYCLMEPALGFYLLADGMGGAQAGERASRLAVETVASMLSAAPVRDPQALLSAVEEANRRVIETGKADPLLDGMGTTLVAALDMGDDLCIASVGDSRAYVCDQAGLRRITDDQTWVNQIGRPLGLDEATLRTHPLRHVLTMAIGAGAPLTINHYAAPLATGTLALLCSDGLHGVVSEPVLEQILRSGLDGVGLEECCHRLVDAAKQAGGPDNVTVVLLRKAE